MKSYKPIHDAFRRLNTSTIAWHKTAGFPKSAETANQILHRDMTVDASTLAYMAHCLDIPNDGIIKILEAYAKEVPAKTGEVAVLRALIVPVQISAEEQELINSLRKLDDSKRALVMDLVGKLA